VVNRGWLPDAHSQAKQAIVPITRQSYVVRSIQIDLVAQQQLGDFQLSLETSDSKNVGAVLHQEKSRQE